MSHDLEMDVREIIAGALLMKEADLPVPLSQDTCARWTSLYHLTIVVALEERFGVTFTTEEIVRMTSSEAIARVLFGRGLAAEPPPVRTS
jgi:acyl carrier protein